MLKHELIHIILSVLGGLIVFRFYRNWKVFIYSFLGGFFIDIDHLFDYFRYKKVFIFNLSEFEKGLFFKATNKVFVLFHGFEYAIILILVGLILIYFIKKLSDKKLAAAWFMIVFGLSLFFHLCFDQYSYRPKWQAYFISYRIYCYFDHNKLGFK